MKKYIVCLILLLCILVPRTNSKYVISNESILSFKSANFNVTETTNGPVEFKNIKKDFIEIKIKNNTTHEVKGELVVEGVKLQDVAVASSKEITYKLTLTPELFNKLKEKQIYPVKVNYLSPYKVTKDITTLTVKKEEPGIWGKIKSMSLGNAKDLGIDYSKSNSETNGEGVYLFDETKNDEKPVYFFRGTHNLNNNLIYANLCWKIVRTTETGGVRIVYNGAPVNGKCTTTTGSSTQIGKSTFNANFKKKQYVGYMYGEDTNPYQNTNDSDIKKYIDNWYKTNIKDKGFESSLDKKSIYCGDKTEGRDMGKFLNYAGRDRMLSGKPTMKCPSNDSYGLEAGNRKLTYPVGLLSVDDVNIAGEKWADYNRNYYLYTNQWYWLLSPSFWKSSGSAVVADVDEDGYLGNNPVTRTSGVRPAITIKGDSTIYYGDGSKDKPFVMTTTLAARVKADSLGTDKDNGIDYKKSGSGTNGEGVYIFDETKNDTYPVYFYRGTHNLNNNLLYANLCWKIVRTTETGGVRILYNGAPVNGKCTNTKGTNTQIGRKPFNENDNKKQYVGYMYGDDSNPYQNTNDSDIKKYTDNWYKTNIKDRGFESSLDKGSIYCGDRTEGTNKRSYFYYAGYDRLKQNKPSLKCPSNDSYSVETGNRKLTYPVGLLSVDELNLAGAALNNNYLYSGTWYWLLSPGRWYSSGRAYVFNMYPSRGLRDSLNGSPGGGVRPALTVAPSVLLLSGDGSQNNPYVI